MVGLLGRRTLILGCAAATLLAGVFFAVFIGSITEGGNPDWSSQPTPDCYIGLQTLILAVFLSYLPFAIVGGALMIAWASYTPSEPR